MRVDDPLAELLEQLAELLLGAPVDELVVLERLDRSSGILGELVERLTALRRDALQQASRAVVRGVLEPLVDAAPLRRHDAVEPLLDVVEDRVEVVALELLLAAPPQLLEHLLESDHAPA